MTNPIQELLQQTGPGLMSPSAYDTSWIARLGDIAPDLSKPAMEWLSENQLPDGSWGAPAPMYYHDRVISTLAAMLALTRTGKRTQDKRQIEKGLIALEQINTNATKGLMADPNGATIGFELIVPTLVAEAESIGILKQHKERILGRLERLRRIKLEKMQGLKINRYVTMAFSAEMAGSDKQDMLDVDLLQEDNGSVGHSPSASAYFATYIRPGDPRSLQYLRQVSAADGSVPDLLPFEIYEKSWILWNLALVDSLDQETLALFQPHLDHLQAAWNNQKGVSLSKGYSVPDGDNTCITFDLLTRFNRPANIQGLLSFEENDHFRCYDLEANPSISVNIHALIALRSAGYMPDHPTTLKILHYLEHNRTNYGYWFDKWHISPFYTTAHAILACINYSDDLIKPAIDWMISSQRSDGSWGFYVPTAEETAYCIQALCILKKNGRNVPPGVLLKAVEWLKFNSQPPYPLFWIGKGLYAGELVVRSAILSALELAKGL
jgi:halimadienyl-diphosphate synthase